MENPPVTPVLENVPAIEFYDPEQLEPETTYYWRVDCKNEAGTVTGEVWSFTTGLNTGVDFNSSPEKRILISPNPAFENVKIKSRNMISIIQIFDATGSLILTEKPDNTLFIMDVAGIIPGIYFIQIISNEHLQFEKLIVQ